MENAAGYRGWVVLAKAFATLKDFTAYLVSSGEKKTVIFFKKSNIISYIFWKDNW